MSIRSIRKRNRPTFKDQGESFGKAFDKSLSAIDPKVADKKEKVKKTPQIEEGDDNQASGTSEVSKMAKEVQALGLHNFKNNMTGNQEIIKNPGGLNINAFNYASDLNLERMMNNFKGNLGPKFH